jgi:hypothetical protein
VPLSSTLEAKALTRAASDEPSADPPESADLSFASALAVRLPMEACRPKLAGWPRSARLAWIQGCGMGLGRDGLASDCFCTTSVTLRGSTYTREMRLRVRDGRTHPSSSPSSC